MYTDTDAASGGLEASIDSKRCDCMNAHDNTDSSQKMIHAQNVSAGQGQNQNQNYINLAYGSQLTLTDQLYVNTNVNVNSNFNANQLSEFPVTGGGLEAVNPNANANNEHVNDQHKPEPHSLPNA